MLNRKLHANLAAYPPHSAPRIPGWQTLANPQVLLRCALFRCPKAPFEAIFWKNGNPDPQELSFLSDVANGAAPATVSAALKSLI